MKFSAFVRIAFLASALAVFSAQANAQKNATPVLVSYKAPVSGLDSATVLTVAQIIADSFGAEVALIEEFIREAKLLEKDEKVPAEVFIGIAILESTGFTSYLYQNAKNPFGMRATSIWKGKTFVMFHEGADAPFRKYDTSRGAVRDFSKFLRSRKWFRDAFLCKASDSECFIKALSSNWKKREPGYASDPEWPNKVRRVIQKYQLELLKG
jgi:flagellum-specific peptidoglycan hydrolase FlgJ